MQQYVDRVEEFLEALLSRESMPDSAGTCRHCDESIAVWRCRDCTLATPKCRACMRRIHQENPFHRIERWNGTFFSPAELKDVGVYLLVRHHAGILLCDTLTRWCDILNSAEKVNDRMEQDQLRRCISVEVPVPVPESQPYPEGFEKSDDIDMENSAFEEEGEDVGDGDEELEDYAYFEEANAGAGAGADPVLASTTLGHLIRVVHTNGLHHIAMVSCTCNGDEHLPLDLFAAQLLPASLKRIRTIFTAEVLDHFRLSNLELKASAYQYYHLLRRITRPMGPGEVLNLYREFRRMTRIWRWMKKLKWAGYAGTSKKVAEVGAGELAIFCPACPQAGINIPDNWREDPARHVFIIFIKL
jgi:hypothetical protein